MAQLISVRLNRGDACPWGFRLQGGKDFGTPLVIQKVNSGSPAERAGLQAGDAVIKVNNTDVYNLRHKDAQDAIVRAGQSFEVTVQRGGSTWQPQVVPTGVAPKPSPLGSYVSPVTKTSLAAKPQDPMHIGSGHNNKAKPFASVQLNGTGPKNLVNKQYNTPLNIYSEQTIKETLDKHSEVLETGVVGVNFKKNEKIYNAANSEVFKMLQEADNEPEKAPISPVHVTAPSSDHSHQPMASPAAPVSGLRHVSAPVDRPATNNTGGLPAGQNICADCERLIVGVFVRIKDKNLHVECFKCATCGTNLKNQGYYTIHNKLYCDIHAKLVARQNPPAGTEGCIPFTVPPGGKIPVSAISAALAAHSSHPLNGGMAPPKDQAPSTPGYAPVSAPLSGNLSGPKPYSFGAPQASPLSPVSAPLSPYSAPLSPLVSQQQQGKFPTTKPGVGFKEVYVNRNEPEEGASQSQPIVTSLESLSSTIESEQQRQINTMQIEKTEDQDSENRLQNLPTSELSDAHKTEDLKTTDQVKANEQIQSNIEDTVNQETKTESQEIKTESQEIKTESQEIKTERYEMKTETREIKAATQEINADSHEIKTETPETNTLNEKLDEKLQEDSLSKSNVETKQSSQKSLSEASLQKNLQAEKKSSPSKPQISEQQQTKNQCILKESLNKEIISRSETTRSSDNVEISRDALADSNKVLENKSETTVKENHTQKPLLPDLSSQETDSKSDFDNQPKINGVINGILNEEIKSESSSIDAVAGLKTESSYSNKVTEFTSKTSTISGESLEERQEIPLTSMPSFKNISDMQKLSNYSTNFDNDSLSKTPEVKPGQIFYVAESFLSQSKNSENIKEEKSSCSNNYTEEQMKVSAISTEKLKAEHNVQSNTYTHISQNTNSSTNRHDPTNPIYPFNKNSNLPRKNIQKDVTTNSCLPQMKVNHPSVGRKVNNPSSNEPHSTQAPSTNRMSLSFALTIAPEKPFSLATSPVNFSYTDTPSYVPASDMAPIYTSFQPIQTFSKTDKGKNIPVHKPFSPLSPTKPVVESPASPKTSVPFKRTLSFPPPLPDEIINTDAQAESTESYKTQVRAPSTPITNENKIPLYMNIAPRPASTTPKNFIPSVLPVYQTNAVSTEHRGVQSNVFIPKAAKGFENKYNKPSSEILVTNPDIGSLNYDTGCETYQEESKVHHDYDKLTGLRRTTNVQESMRHKEHNRQQTSNTSKVETSPNMIKTIERRHTVKEEYEHTQKAKTIEIRTGPDGKVVKQEISHPSPTVLSFPPPNLSSNPSQQFGQSTVNKHHQTLSQSHQLASSSLTSAYGPQSLNQCTLPHKTGFPTLKSPGVSSTAKTISNPLVCDPTPPGAGGVSAPKGGAFGVSTAPKRGRGILNKAALTGSRVPLCGHCNSYVRGPFISALGRIWCPSHFVCSNGTCKRPLADIGFVEEQGQLYCEYCFEQYIAPPCDKCHAKIKGDCLNAIGKHFHPECFNCVYCGKLFGNNPFFLEDGQPYCQADWNEMFTTKCFACGFPVEAGDRWVEALSNNYHSQCFNCTMCKKNLEGQSFYAKGGRPFCKNHAR